MDAPAASGGGCSASGTGIFAFLLILPAALFRRRR
ncbi:MAG: SYNERG-CTERM sorting domain-containing protein [Synergistales bacterium]|nr:SYNERG-CTERM sorting domain-containing protein [Synergistales bacterium]